MPNRDRKPKGVSTGGQFAPQTHAEADVTLTEPADTTPPADLPEPLPELNPSTTSRSVMPRTSGTRSGTRTSAAT